VNKSQHKKQTRKQERKNAENTGHEDKQHQEHTMPQNLGIKNTANTKTKKNITKK